MRLWLTLLVLAVLAGAAWWLRQHFNPEAQPQQQAVSHAPDYYFEGATITQMNKSGQLQYKLLSSVVTHHPDDGSVDLTAPRLTWYGDAPGKAAPWHVTAKHGMIPAGADIVHLRGDVVVTHPTDTGETLKIFSPTLDLYTEKRIARTADPVKIVRGPSHVNAVGMVIQMDQNHMRLESTVRGTYVH
ncbi:MAG TPA: LPS export ABC transporter periplasmic protein LptC [Gammaproteobacteria bacterium]|nr:LPS export ABC transporter periplasmic protein LptC [Gammaproteobacteria bacterium]